MNEQVNERAQPSPGFARQRRRPRVGTIILIVLLHIAALYGLGRAFAPDFTQSVESGVVAAFTVTVTAPEDPPPSEPAPEEGAAGDAGERATPRPETAPRPEIPVRQDRPLPEASSDGNEDSSGAREVGEGTGEAGTGIGTGSGREGSGTGGAAVTKPPRSGDPMSSPPTPALSPVPRSPPSRTAGMATFGDR